MALAGFTRFRSHQIGKQTVIGTAVPATRRRAGVRGGIVINPNRTDADFDTGSLDPIPAPYSTLLEVTLPVTGTAAFNELTDTFCYGLKGGVTASVVSSTDQWIYQVASLTADPFDYATYEYGSDTNATDGIQAVGGVINSFELSVGEDLGPFDLTEEWRFANAVYGSALTGALAVDPAPAWVFGGGLQVYLNTTAGTIGTTALADAVHGVAFRVDNALDFKRFANGLNGSNLDRRLGGYGRGARVIEYEVTAAKTAATMAEALTLDDVPTPERFIEFRITSAEIISGVIPFSLSLRSPVRLFEVTQGEIGGNETLTFLYRARYESATLAYALRAVLVNSRATL